MLLPENISLIENGFKYDGVRYQFSDVRSIRFGAVSVKHSTNFVKTHDSLHSDMEIHFTRSELGKRGSLKIGANKGFFTDYRNYEKQKKLTDALFNFYAVLAKATFQQRLRYYIESGDDTVAFRYGKFVFFKDGVIVKNSKLYAHLDRNEHNIMKTYSEILLEKKGLLGKAVNELFGSKSFDILSDKDVILQLLSHFYGLSWS